MFGFLRKRRHEALRAEPFPEDFARIIDRNVAHARRLSAEDRTRLCGLVRIFLDQVRFEGCGGLEITDEIRVTIAAQACILLLHRDHDEFKDLEVVLVYPNAYRAPAPPREQGIVLDEPDVRLGESWSRGEVILAWDHVKRGAIHETDGQNVVLHEFAHQLDAEDGAVDGAPPLETRAQYATWARVFGREFRELTKRLDAHKFVDIDPYAAENPPEFFAVVTEMFFEKPSALRKRHPELYAELARFYGQDPASNLS
ncbi:MAG: M90 family metallopeptidase [Polyangiaceae bacterium]